MSYSSTIMFTCPVMAFPSLEIKMEQFCSTYFWQFQVKWWQRFASVNKPNSISPVRGRLMQIVNAEISQVAVVSLRVNIFKSLIYGVLALVCRALVIPINTLRRCNCGIFYLHIPMSSWNMWKRGAANEILKLRDLEMMRLWKFIV